MQGCNQLSLLGKLNIHYLPAAVVPAFLAYTVQTMDGTAILAFNQRSRFQFVVGTALAAPGFG